MANPVLTRAVIEAALPNDAARRLIEQYGLDEDSAPPARSPAPSHLWDDLQALTGNPIIGASAALRLQLSGLGRLAALLSSLPDLRACLDATATLLPSFYSEVRLQLRVERGTAACEYISMAPHRTRMLNDFIGILTWRIGKALIPDFELTEVDMPHRVANPEEEAFYQRIFRCPIHFHQDRLRLKFDAKRLDAPIETSDAALEEQVRKWAQTIGEVPTPEDYGRLDHAYVEALIAADGRETELATVARRLDKTPRALRRMLERCATNHTEQVSRARHRLAAERLRTSDHSIEEISTQLGFASASGFIRAFKRWTGTTPAKYRRRYRRKSGTRELSHSPHSYVAGPIGGSVAGNP